MNYTFLMTLGWVASVRCDSLPPGRIFLAPVEPADVNSDFRRYQKIADHSAGIDIETSVVQEFDGWVWIEEPAS